MKKLALIGKMRSGKDTVADYLAVEYGYRKIPLALGVYKVAHDIFGMSGKNRKLLIDIGAALRGIDENVWIDHVLRLAGTSKNVIVSDVRYLNEYEVLKEHGYTFIKVYAPDALRIQRGADEAYIAHPTECYLDHIEADWMLVNNGSTADLYDQVDAIMERMQ